MSNEGYICTICDSDKGVVYDADLDDAFCQKCLSEVKNNTNLVALNPKCGLCDSVENVVFDSDLKEFVCSVCLNDLEWEQI